MHIKAMASMKCAQTTFLSTRDRPAPPWTCHQPAPLLSWKDSHSLQQFRLLSRNSRGLASSHYPALSCAAVAALEDGVSKTDAEYMQMCVSLARQALGHTSPNPMVGCVIVKDGHVIGRGFHPKAGEPHAEVFALREAGTNSKGATAYVSLEPCNHFGRTPPCTHALIQARVKRVVMGMLDPNPIVAGKGVEALTRAGIEVIIGVEEASCKSLNEAYIHRMLFKRPFTTLRFSTSLDGAFLGVVSIDSVKGSYFSKLLQQNDAVILPDAVLSDDPVLVSAEPGSKQPIRIILTDSFMFPLNLSVFDTSISPTIVIASEHAILADSESKSERAGQLMESLLQQRGVEVMAVKELALDSVLDICYERGLCSVLLDSRSLELPGFGNSLGRKALEEKVVQKLVVAISPVICGNTKAGPGFVVDNGLLHLERVSTTMSGLDVIIEGYIPQ